MDKIELESIDEMDDQYPRRDINACRKDKKLSAMREPPELAGYTEKKCQKCGKKELEWLYFRSPPSTWEHLCGVEGWVLVCKSCEWQNGEYPLVMS